MFSRQCCLLPTLLFAAVCSAQSGTAGPATAQPKEVTFPSGKLVLHGFIYKPEGNCPFPALLWNHGSERRPGWLPELGPLFISNGYVLFIPHRRGQGRSPGEYIMDLLRQENQLRGPSARNRKLVELMERRLTIRSPRCPISKRSPMWTLTASQLPAARSAGFRRSWRQGAH